MQYGRDFGDRVSFYFIFNLL
ncbi:hypothetical protein [Staphylococcus aureus]